MSVHRAWIKRGLETRYLDLAPNADLFHMAESLTVRGGEPAVSPGRPTGCGLARG